MSGKKTWITILIVAVCAAGIATLTYCSDQDSSSLTDPSLDEEKSQVAKDARRARKTENSVPIKDDFPLPASSPQPADENSGATTAPEPESSGFLISGTATRLLTDLDRAPPEDGSFILWTVSPTQRYDVTVVAGEWSLRLQSRSDIRIVSLSLGGVAVLHPGDPLSLPSDNRVHIAGRGLSPTALRVVDFETGQDLDGVDIAVASASGSTRKRGHPGRRPSAFLLSKAHSPLEVPAPTNAFWSTRLYWVRAHGYAWKACALDHTHKASTTPVVALRPSGELHIELVDYQAKAQATIELRTGDRPEYITFARATPEPGGTLLMESLLPGNYRIDVVKGVWKDAIRMGRAEATVTAGSRTQVTIKTEPIEIPTAKVSFDGKLIMPKSWNPEQLKLAIAPANKTRAWADGNGFDLKLDPMKDQGDGLLGWTWSTILPVSGQYDVVVHPLQIRRPFIVGPEGLTDALIRLEEPAEVTVALIEEDTEAPTGIRHLSWSGPRSKFTYAWSSETVTLNEQTDLFSFTAPIGALQIGIDSKMWEITDPYATWTTRPGRNHFKILARRTTGVHLIFKDGNRTIPWSWDWQVGAKQDGDVIRPTRRSIGHLWFAQSGTYELTTNPIAGYRTPKNFHFEAKQGQIVDVIVPLTPTAD